MNQDERDLVLHQMVAGLHAMIFGVASLKHPDIAQEALGDDGQIHEYVHGMLRLLPPKEPK